jgi:hypothetical protein
VGDASHLLEILLDLNELFLIILAIFEKSEGFLEGNDDKLIPAAVDHIHSRIIKVVGPLKLGFHQRPNS